MSEHQADRNDQRSGNGQAPAQPPVDVRDERRDRRSLVAQESSPASSQDAAAAQTFARDLVKELFECLKTPEANPDEDTRLFFPEGVSMVRVRLQVGGNAAPAVDLEFTVSGGQG